MSTTIAQFDLKDFIVISLVVALFTMICLSGKESLENNVLGTTIPYGVSDWMRKLKEMEAVQYFTYGKKIGPPARRPDLSFNKWRWPNNIYPSDIMSPNK